MTGNRGRPRIPDHAKRDYVLGVALTKTEKNLVKAEAERTGRTASEVLRQQGVPLPFGQNKTEPEPV